MVILLSHSVPLCHIFASPNFITLWECLFGVSTSKTPAEVPVGLPINYRLYTPISPNLTSATILLPSPIAASIATGAVTLPAFSIFNVCPSCCENFAKISCHFRWQRILGVERCCLKFENAVPPILALKQILGPEFEEKPEKTVALIAHFHFTFLLRFSTEIDKKLRVENLGGLAQWTNTSWHSFHAATLNTFF